MTLLRIQKYLSQSGVASRRAAEELIREGRVTVNGKLVSEMGVKINPAADVVKVGNRVIRPEHQGVILLHKPRGVVATLSDPEGRPTVSDYMTAHYRSYYPVGRLDFESSGLVIMTNDGELAERLMHPRYGFRRIYEVKVRGRVSDDTIGKMEKGVRLPDGLAKAEVNLIARDEESSTLLVVMSEGRNRLVRRMMEQLGHLVKKLKRVQHGPFKLGSLRPGEIKKLTESEYGQMRKKILGENIPGYKKAVRQNRRGPSRKPKPRTRQQ